MESFATRLDRVFGSLGSKGSTSWRLSDQEMERREWVSCARERDASRDDLIPSPSPSPFSFRTRKQNFFGEFLDADDSLEHGGGRISDQMDIDGRQHINLQDAEYDGEAEYQQVREMVGLDCALDFEDEEDEFDKAAVGQEVCSERLYMHDVKPSKRRNGSVGLPVSIYDMKKVSKDARANLLAAKARLQEDDREAEASQQALPHPCTRDTIETKVDIGEKEHEINSNEMWTPEEEVQFEIHGEEPVCGTKRCSITSILAGPRSKANYKPVKRVRFALDAEQEAKVQAASASITQKQPSSHPSGVPDYVKNPSKYTHYTLDWSTEDNDATNLEAFKACRDALGGKIESLEDVGEPKPLSNQIEFIPRQKGPRASTSKDMFGVVPSLTGMAMSENGQESNCEINMGAEVSVSDTSSASKSIRISKNYRSKKQVAEDEGSPMEA